MTAEQILGIAQVATDALSATPAPQPAAAPPAPADTFDIADTDYVTGADFKRYNASRPVDDTAIRLAADANLSIVRQKYDGDFRKYGAEIQTLLAQVPSNLRTIDNLERVVKMVRSDHVDEIAAERAQQLASTMAPTLRPTGGGGAPAPVSREYSLESEKIPTEWKERARAAKIDENTVAEFCRANDMSLIDFYKQFDTPANAIVSEVGQRRHA